MLQGRPDAGDPHVHGRADADHDDHSGPGTPTRGRARRAEEDTAAFVFAADQPGSTFECSLDEGGLNPADRGLVPVHVADRLLRPGGRRAHVRGARDEPGGRARGAAGAVRVVRRARAGHGRARHADHAPARPPPTRSASRRSSSPARTTASRRSRSSARSTARRTAPARRRRSSPTSCAARTCCWSAPSTPPATAT